MEYPSNSQRANKDDPPKQEVKRLEKVTQGEVVRRKKPMHKRFVEKFFGDTVGGVLGYLAIDILVPAAKDTIVELFSSGVERLFYGDMRPPSRRGGRFGGPVGHTAYNRAGATSPYHQSREELRNLSRRGRSSHDFDEIILATRVEAEEVIDRLFDLVSQYNSATVADLYELVGVTPGYTDNKWGWTDIRGAGVTRIKGGYLLDLPRPEPLD